MARIAIVESYPYESVWGGDAVYLDRMRQFLTARGHRVESYVTNVTRGRTSPLLRLHSRAQGEHQWIVRHALARGKGRFLAYDLRLLGKLLTRISGRLPRPEHDVGKGEEQWLIDQFGGARPDLVVLAFGACTFTKAVAGLGLPVLAVRGFFSDRRIRLGDKLDAAQPSPDKRMLDELRLAAYAGFNNLLDLRYYASATGATNGILLGMGFASRPPLPPSDEAVVIFVGARTRPNIDGLRWFIDGGWPIIRQAVPGARLRIVGAVGSAFKPREPDIEIVGFAEDLDSEYQRAQIVVAPLIMGSSGVKTKLAEALSYGRPVVTTSIGVDPAEPDQFGSAVDVADDPEAFAAAVVRLLTDSDLRIVRNQSAVEQFERHFSERAAYAGLITMLEGAKG